MKKVLLTAITFLFTIIFISGQAPTNGLVAYYPFNGNANDAVGTVNGLTIGGAILTTDRKGNFNSAYLFDGVNDAIRLPNLYNSTNTYLQNVSYSFWFKPSQNYNANSFYALIIRTTDNGFSDCVGKPDFGNATNNKFQFYMWNGMQNYCKSNTINFTANTWYHVVATRSNGFMKIYLNKTREGEVSFTNQSQQYTDLYIGGHSTYGRWYFNGVIDELYIYNRELSQNEINIIYDAESPITDITTGLVAHYKMDGNAQDASGNGNHGTAQNGVAFGTDRFGNAGKAASFDGVDDFVHATSPQSLTTLTTSFWFKPSNLNIQTPFCIGVDDGIGSNSALNGISLFVPSNVVNIISSDQQSIPTGYSFPSANQWYFVSIQQNAGQYKMFVNSNLVFTGNGAIPRPATQIRIGSATNVRFFNGLMDDIRIYNRALTDTEVQALYQAEAPPIDITTGLVAHYKMDGNAQDASGNGNHGTQQGGVNFSTATDRFGVAGKAASFDGVDDYIKRDDATGQLSGYNSITITAWVKTNGTPNGIQSIASKWYQAQSNNTLRPQDCYGLYVNQNLKFQGFTNQYPLAGTQVQADLTTSEWQQVVFVHNNLNGGKIYVNGILKNSISTTGLLSNASNPLLIGADNNLGSIWRYFNGSLDDIRIYNRALSDTEVQQLYKVEAPPIDLTTGLVAHYKMDGNAQDASGNGNHGTQQGGVNFTTAIDRFNVAGKAAGFDGVNDYLSTNLLQNAITKYTISSWIKTAKLTGDMAIVNARGPAAAGGCCSSSRSISSGIGGGKISYTLNSDFIAIGKNSSNSLVSNEWTHVVGVFTSESGQNATPSQFKIYLNGNMVSMTDANYNPNSRNIQNPFTGNGGVKIGTWENQYFFNGSLDDIRIYNRALSDAEVSALYSLENSGEIVTIPITPSLTINPTNPTLGSTITINGSGFIPNSTLTVSLTRDVPNFLHPNQTITVNSLGKFSVLYNNIDGFGTYTANATDINNNSASIKFSPSDGANNARIVKPFNGERIPQIITTGPYPFQLVWNDRVTLTNSNTGSNNNRTVTYLISYKLFNTTTWSADASVVKTLTFGNQENISTTLSVPTLGTYSIRIKHQGASENYVQIDNVVVEQLVGVNYAVSLLNNRFNTPIKGLVADGVSRVKLRYEIEPSSYPIKSILVSLTDPIANKTSKEILGTIVDARGITDIFADSPDFNPTFSQSFTMTGITGAIHDFWYVAPTDFSDGTAFLTDAIRKVKVTFTVTYDQNGTDVIQVNTYDIQIARPPLMMVAGIAFNATDTFKEFTNYMNTYYKRYLYDLKNSLVNVNPGSGVNSYDSNKSDFASNANNLLKGNGAYGTKSFKDIVKIMRELGFVCHRVDYIGHGMGCNLAHAVVIAESGNPYFKLSDTYEAGYINKIINLNAQKNGSPLMDLIEYLLNEVNENPVTTDDLTQATNFIRNYETASIVDKKILLDGAKLAKNEGVILSRLVTRGLLYKILTNLEIPYVRHFIKRVPRKQPVNPTVIINDFVDELGSSEDIRTWFKDLPNQFFSSATKSLDNAFQNLGYFLKSDSLILSDAANELRNNETNLNFNRTLLTTVTIPKSGIHYIVGDLVGGADTTLQNATNWLIDKKDIFDEYSKVLESISQAVELIDNVSDYSYINSKSNFKLMQKDIINRKTKIKLYSNWLENNRVPYTTDQAVIAKYEKIIEYLEMPAQLFKLIGTAANVLTFVFNSDGFASTGSQSGLSISPSCTTCISKFPNSFDAQKPLDGIIKYNYFSLPKQYEVFGRIEDLLNGSINSNLFEKTLKQSNFAPSGINPAIINSTIKNSYKQSNFLSSTSLFGKTVVDTSIVRIKTPNANSTLNVGQNIDVWVELKDTAKFVKLELDFQNKQYIQGEKKRNYLFTIPVNPSETSELLQVKATYNFGLDTTLFIADRIRVNTNNPETLISLKAIPDLVEIFKGEELQQGCLLSYPSYDLTIPVNSSFLISISDTNIVKFDADKNIFIAKDNGTVIVNLTYKSQQTSFVIVVTEPAKSILPFTVYASTCLGKSIKIGWNKLGSFSSNTSYYIELSDANGSFTSPTLLTSGVNITEANVTIPATISIGSNYQIRVRTNLENYITTENVKLKVYQNNPLESTKTGYWTDPSTWSCGEIPNISDNVIIKNFHKVELLPNQSGHIRGLTTEHETILNLGLGSIIEVQH